eukprot:CAMPEP_0197666338 /NCGR_PEP_ID=MMETSP1338-20131121/62190_1 /TAXON_ID=43686 ORGANISM="Pelagodinium beii, Strain RCC1491" /NCGR_SAMPLE_ID=MMETSP1338 /ASSEMBLY_ACC=CAM_ASM_000754 /LENGTH=84 /DNA_ID=CAMNT_0043245351 /DNA_START=114 /DNA_END=368 /DNA_ORIENTATION=+
MSLSIDSMSPGRRQVVSHGAYWQNPPSSLMYPHAAPYPQATSHQTVVAKSAPVTHEADIESFESVEEAEEKRNWRHWFCCCEAE